MRRRLSVPVFVLHVLVGTAGAQLAVARQYLAQPGPDPVGGALGPGADRPAATDEVTSGV